MNSKIVTILALIAIVFGTAYGANIKLQVFPASNQWWLALDPVDDLGATKTIEVQEGSSSTWTTMTSDLGYGYHTYQASNGKGFIFPLSFRLTDNEGNQVVISDALKSVSAGSTLDLGQAFDGSSAPVKQARKAPAASTPSCGSEPATPTTQPTTKPTTKPTTAPTSRPTSAPTTKPTKPSTSGSNSGSSSNPTTKPTSPTTKPTTKPSTSGSSSSSSGSSTDLCSVTSTSSEPLKMLVPLYVYPGSAWDQVVTAAATGVKIIAIINPNSGPDANGPDSSYKTYMQKLTTAGVDMVGYIHTSYGARSISDVQKDISTYASKYPGLKGIFVDEASADASEVAYYTQVYNAIKANSGYANTILNPGTQPDQGYLDISTNIVIFESPASSLKSSFASWVKCAPNASEKAGWKYKFSGIAYGASQGTMTSTINTMMTAGMGLVYVTDGAAGCCTYNTLTSYMSAMATTVKALN